jgi:hypothetical protein
MSNADLVAMAFQIQGKSSPCLINNPGPLPAPVQERFFEKYFTWERQGGTGLGTYVSRLLTKPQKEISGWSPTIPTVLLVFRVSPDRVVKITNSSCRFIIPASYLVTSGVRVNPFNRLLNWL